MAIPSDPIRSGSTTRPDAPEYGSTTVPRPPAYPGAEGSGVRAVPPPPPAYPTETGTRTEPTPRSRPPLRSPIRPENRGREADLSFEAEAEADAAAAVRQPYEHDGGFGHRRRVHLSKRQRRVDATAIGQLVLQTPPFILSLVIVMALSYAVFSQAGWVVVVLWLASGALAFHRPTESAFARHLLNLRYPTPWEHARLEPVWREVTARAGVEGRAYELWIEESDDLNALAAAGHIVGVTRFSLENLPDGHLAAVLAHELAHHVGGHAWSSLLGEWYAVPGRLAWAIVRRVARFVVALGRRLNGCLGLALLLAAAGTVVAFSLAYWFVILALVVAPYPLAAVARRSELRADQHAAALGFGPMLAEVLQAMHTEVLGAGAPTTASFAARGNTGAFGSVAPAHSNRPRLLGRLLASHPDYHTRLHHLAPYLGARD